jgi:hypothetical protein
MLEAFTPGSFHVTVRPATPQAFPTSHVQPSLNQSSTLRQIAGISLAAAGTALVACNQRQKRTSRVAAAAGWKADPAKVGATLPLANPADGVPMWDPLGFCKDNKVQTFDKYRAAEKKHGRVAMMATVGLIVQHYWRIKLVTPDQIIPLDGPSGLGALSAGQPSAAAFGLLFLMTGFVELGVLKNPEGAKPWDFGDPAGWRKSIAYLDIDDATLASYELEHGRLAMFGVIGTLSAELVSGYDAVEQWEHWGDWITDHF